MPLGEKTGTSGNSRNPTVIGLPKRVVNFTVQMAKRKIPQLLANSGRSVDAIIEG